MAWNFLMKNRADTRVNKNNTINIIQNNTDALNKLSSSIDTINKTLENFESRITSLEKSLLIKK